VSDVGPGSSELIEKRITTNIMRLEYGIASQELELLESQDKIERIKANIAAQRKEIEQERKSLEATKKGQDVDG
jgi:capsule polysaccharide export protein KpsE/RkpR